MTLVNKIIPSIRSKFIALFIVFGLVPLIIVGTFSYKSASNALLIQTREQLGNIADKTAQQLDTFLNVVEKDIRLLADFPFIQLSFLQFEFGQRLETAKRLVDDYLENNPYYNRILLINLEGDPILTRPQHNVKSSHNLYATNWFKSAKTRDLYFSDIIVKQPLSDSILMLTKKVYDFKDRTKPVGILVFEIKASSFTSFVSSVKIGDQGFSFLLNKEGNLIYHPEKNLVSNKTLIENGDARLAILVDKMQLGIRGFGEYIFRHQKKFMVFAPCQTKDWSVGITLQRSEFMADIIKLRQQVVTFISLTIFLTTAALLIFVRSLTRPISQLISGARAIGSGDLDQIIQVTSSNELQGLAKEFNNMAARLKKSMRQIVELKTFSDDILRSVSSGIITVDKKGRLTSINKSAEDILSFSKNQIPIKKELEAGGHNTPPGIDQALALLMKTLKENDTLEHQVIDSLNRLGEPVFIEINTSLLNDSSNNVIGAIADIRNITLRKQMEELMVRIDKLASLGELSAGIAHEIRNPLAGMKTSIQVLAKKLTAPSQQMLISGVLSEIDRLNEIVTDLLKFSGSAPSFPMPVDIKLSLKKTLDLLGEKVKYTDVCIVTDYDTNLPMAFLDREQIQQVFLNLILNALTAMPQGGTLTILAKRITNLHRLEKKLAHVPDGKAFLEISFMDTGTGIKKEDLPRVFNPFFTTAPNGTGLGLPIVHKLLEKNKAYIYINSKENQGCHVSLILPAADEPPAGPSVTGDHTRVNDLDTDT